MYSEPGISQRILVVFRRSANALQVSTAVRYLTGLWFRRNNCRYIKDILFHSINTFVQQQIQVQSDVLVQSQFSAHMVVSFPEQAYLHLLGSSAFALHLTSCYIRYHTNTFANRRNIYINPSLQKCLVFQSPYDEPIQKAIISHELDGAHYQRLIYQWSLRSRSREQNSGNCCWVQEEQKWKRT